MTIAEKLHMHRVPVSPMERLSSQDRERLLRIALQVLSGETDTLLVTRNAKGKGLFIKGLVYEDKLKHKR